jgi:hypothetical protein
MLDVVPLDSRVTMRVPSEKDEVPIGQHSLFSYRFFHTPPNLVVERVSRSSKAARGEDLQVEHPILCRHSSPFYPYSDTFMNLL